MTEMICIIDHAYGSGTGAISHGACAISQVTGAISQVTGAISHGACAIWQVTGAISQVTGANCRGVGARRIGAYVSAPGAKQLLAERRRAGKDTD